ncbi:hypothetical protein E3A20_03610, partial [Planctomyces bekefii]
DRWDQLRIASAKVLSRAFDKEVLNAWAGTSGDTSIKIFKKFARNKRYKWDYATPIWDVRPGLKAYSPGQRMLWHLLPDAMRYLPKNPMIASPFGFNHYGYFDVESLFRCESYIWRQQPFAFHIRGCGIKDLSPEVLERTFSTFK